jgi:peptide/nickel transport system permease protein
MRNRGLLGYLGRRLLMLIPLALLVTFVVFMLTSLVPGGPVAALLGGKATDTATVEAIKEKYRLNDPLIVQYLHWLGGVFHGDLGTSIFTSQPVSTAIGDRIGVTVALNVIGITLALLVGVTMGITAAYHRGSTLDRMVVGLNVFLGSTPHFVFAIGALFFFGYKLDWFPLYGLGEGGFWDTAWHLVLPGLVMAVGSLGFVTKMTRASMLDQLDQDYVAFAKARGLGFRRILSAYTLRNALVPILTTAGLLVIGLLTGTVFVEAIFGIPGLGGMLVDAVTNSDVPVIQGLVLVIAAWIILANLVIDLLYAMVDPRVTFSRAAG